MDRTLMLVLIDALMAVQAFNESEETEDYAKRGELRDESRVLVRAALRLARQCGEMPQEPTERGENLKAVA